MKTQIAQNREEGTIAKRRLQKNHTKYTNQLNKRNNPEKQKISTKQGERWREIASLNIDDFRAQEIYDVLLIRMHKQKIDVARRKHISLKQHTHQIQNIRYSSARLKQLEQH